MPTTAVTTPGWHDRRQVRSLAGVLATTCGFALAVTFVSGLFLPPVASAAPKPHAKLTASGAKLEVGQTANVPYEVTTTSKVSSTLAITVRSVRRGSISDLKDFDLDAQSKEGVPFYVTASFRNVGTRSMKPSGLFGDLTVYDKQGDSIDSLTLLGDFPKCEGTEPATLGIGRQFTECDVYIAPKGKPAASVVFDHFVDHPSSIAETKITWRAG